MVVSQGSERQVSGTKVRPGKCKDGKACIDLGVGVGRRTFRFKEQFVDRRKEKFQLLGIGNVSEYLRIYKRRKLAMSVEVRSGSEQGGLK